MRYIRNIIISFCFLAGMQSCLIENDMSYPRTVAEITAFSVEGQKSVNIDAATRTVTVELDELADISAVTVTSSSVTDGAVCDDFPVPGTVLDLTHPKKYVLSIYYDYEWTVSAVQNIDRYVRCDNQLGEASFNLKDREVTVYVSDVQDLRKVMINEMKLEAEGSEIVSTTGYETSGGSVVEKTVECSFPMELDCLLQRRFTVMDRGETIEWTMSVVSRQVSLAVSSANAWCYHVDVEAVYSGDGTPYMEYRQYGADEWTRFDDVDVDGLSVKASIPGGDTSEDGSERLLPGTAYEVRICTGDGQSSPVSFTTGTPDQIENMGFDQWWNTKADNTGSWYPNPDSGTKVWDTANGGTAILGNRNPTVPETEFLATSDQSNTAAARLSSLSAGMFAAGNLYTGEFLGTSLSPIGARLNWGVPFTARPKALKGYYAYSPKIIDYAREPYKDLIGETDQCQLLVILTDMEAPFTVDTANNIFMDQSSDNGNIIAYAKFESPEDTGGKYREFNLELEYWRPDAVPKYAIVIACASYLGNYFTGAVGSTMYVDEFEFVYD